MDFQQQTSGRCLAFRTRTKIAFGGFGICIVAGIGVDAVILGIAQSVSVHVGRTSASTNTQGIQLVALAIAVAVGDDLTSTFVNRSRSIANATRVERSNAVVDVVAHAIGVFIGSTVTAAHAQSIELVAVTVAVAFRDAVATAHTALVQHVAVAVTRTFSDAVSSADATFVQHQARAVVVGGTGVAVARHRVRATACVPVAHSSVGARA